MNLWFAVLVLLPALSSVAQSQSCPLNINFSQGNLGHWEAYTGNNKDGNGPGAIKLVYDSNQTSGATAYPEYNLQGVDGIQVITGQGFDAFGGFPMIPTINGYAYQYSILLGSTAVANRQPVDPNNPSAPPANTGPQGGYIRGVRYYVDVPPGPTSVPYTMTYAYAMVLENGTHPSEQQPMARAIVSTPGGVITCASPAYFLPTNGGLDSATIRANGFSPSPTPTPNGSTQNPALHLQDVWTKGWTEVTFDLSPYRGQQVLLTFEADNCVPGGHFAYAYFSIKNICAGLQISGDTIACANNIGNYYIPTLDSASYNWSIPDGWVLRPGRNENSISVTVGPQPGWIVATETNTCSTLTDSLFVHLFKGALPQGTFDPRDTIVCFGEAAPLHALITTGTSYSWASTGSFSGRRKGTIPSRPFVADILAAPDQTTEYVLNIINEGCPVPVSDTFTVAVVPPVRVDIGRDTLVVVNQPLHFHATSSDTYKDTYQWSPSTDLSNPDIADPIAVYGDALNTISYQVTATDSIGCYGAATVKVTIAHTLPDIFVPNAFTPGSGVNTIFRPVCMGISSLEYFRVYNRWGQLLFSTSRMGQGWDGRIHGLLQESDSYMWMAKGTDYTGRVIAKKGTVVLIR